MPCDTVSFLKEEEKVTMPAQIHHGRVGDSSVLIPHTYPGRLIAAEGLDGSGKSTQLRLLQFWLQSEGYDVLIAEWTPSKLFNRALKAGKKEGHLDPMLLSILYAADFAELYESEIVPALRHGIIVLIDRYVYTALARDMARGVDRIWLETIYRFAAKPDLALYFRINADQSLERILRNIPRLKYYQTGMDLGLSNDPIVSFRAFQARISHEYAQLIKQGGLLELDATLPIRQQQQILRAAVAPILPGEQIEE